jgi:hypothetical protein
VVLISTDFHCNEKFSLQVTCEDVLWNGSVRQIGCSKPALALPNVWAPAQHYIASKQILSRFLCIYSSNTANL